MTPATAFLGELEHFDFDLKDMQLQIKPFIEKEL